MLVSAESLGVAGWPPREAEAVATRPGGGGGGGESSGDEGERNKKGTSGEAGRAAAGAASLFSATGPLDVRRVLLDALAATEGHALRAALDTATAAVEHHAAREAGGVKGHKGGKGGNGGRDASGDGGGGGACGGEPFLVPLWGAAVFAVAAAVGAVAGAAWRRG